MIRFALRAFDSRGAFTTRLAVSTRFHGGPGA